MCTGRRWEGRAVGGVWCVDTEGCLVLVVLGALGLAAAAVEVLVLVVSSRGPRNCAGQAVRAWHCMAGRMASRGRGNEGRQVQAEREGLQGLELERQLAGRGRWGRRVQVAWGVEVRHGPTSSRAPELQVRHRG